MSRADLSGIFWHDVERVSGRGQAPKIVRPLPPIPDTGWYPPVEFPRLDAAESLAIDVETYDPDLNSRGPGVRTNGKIVGLAIGTPDGHRWYFPMRHEVQSEMNLDPEVVLRFARDELCRPNQPKVGANILYDLDYLYAADVPVTGPFFDVQVAEPLLDENARTYSLDAIGERHLGEGKVDDALYQWSARAYGGKPERAQAVNIYRCPPSLVGPYAEGDVDLPLRILEKQRALLARDDLTELFDLESRLIPLLLAMRRRGVRVDLQGATRVYDMLTARIEQAQKNLGGINVYAATEIAGYCRKHNIEFAMTEQGNPSFTQSYLENHPDATIRGINEVRKWYKTRDTFIKGYILDLHIKGRLHALFNQLRSDEGGTVSGRFSSSNPNLQNIPVRDPELGKIMRALFLPEEGERWARLDWSQIEFRFLTHYGRGEGADIAREMYRKDPNTDFHQMVAELTRIDRKPAKNINFGLVYGMGERHMAETLGRTLEDVKPLFETYHRRLPFVRNTYNEVSKRAAQKGYIFTILKRRRRFDMWEVASWNKGEQELFPSREEGLLKYPDKQFRRAFTNKALNALLQGSAADAMKHAMVRIWESGLCGESVLGAPLLTVHDELDFSFGTDKLEAINEVRHIMETCIPLRVPVIADLEVGVNWGLCEPVAPYKK